MSCSPARPTSPDLGMRVQPAVGTPAGVAGLWERMTLSRCGHTPEEVHILLWLLKFLQKSLRRSECSLRCADLQRGVAEAAAPHISFRSLPGRPRWAAVVRARPGGLAAAAGGHRGDTKSRGKRHCCHRARGPVI